MNRVVATLLVMNSFLNLFSQECYTYLEGAAFKANSNYQKIEVIEPDSYGGIWFNLVAANIAFDNGGLVHWSNNIWNEFNMSNCDLPSNKVNAIAFDSKKQVWVGTDKGISVFDGVSHTNWVTYNTSKGLPDENVTSLIIDVNDTVWAGLTSGKIIKIYNDSIEIVADVSPQLINCIFMDAEHKIWLGLNSATGSKKGIATISNSKLEFVDCPVSITSFVQDSQGYLFGSSMTGIYSNKSVFWQNLYPLGSIYKISKGNSGFWVNSNDSIFKISKNEVSIFSNKNSGLPLNGAVLTKAPVVTDALGKTWFAYYKSSSSGLAYMETSQIQTNLFFDTVKYFCSGSEVSLDAGKGFDYYYWNNDSTTATVISKKDFTFKLVVSDSNCFIYDTIHTKIMEPYSEEKICLVTVDNETGKNLIVWNRTAGKGTASYNIYKETDNAGEYAILDNIPAYDLSVYVDKASEPSKRSNRYKISVVDTCGNESKPGNFHKTVHLTVNQGTEGQFNLIWENYEGIDFKQYKIFRGTTPDNMEQIGISPSNNTTYTDDPDTGTWYYQIVMVLEEPCAPKTMLKAGAGPYSEAVSNMEKRLRSSSSSILYKKSPRIQLYRVNSDLKLDIQNNELRNVQLGIFDLQGKRIFSKNIALFKGEILLKIPQFRNGIYVINLIGPEIFYSNKFLIE